MMNRSIAEGAQTGAERDGLSGAGSASSSPAMSPRARRRLSPVLFLTALLFCAWFFQAGHVNQTARYDAVSAFFENTGADAHTFRIDRYCFPDRNGAKRLNTTDWSEYKGHYYSNKSPGTTWFGVALLAPVYPLERRICPDGDGISPRAEIFNAWYLNFMMGVLPTAFSVLALAGILLRLGASEARAYPGALLIVLGTAVFPFATTLMAHSTVAACLVFALWAYLRGGRFSLAASGAWFGAAVLFDYSAGLLLPLALVFLAVRDKGRIWQFLAGGIPFAVLYCAYNAMCFGGPFSFAAQHINPVYRTEGDAGGLLALPNPWLVLELLFGARRGVLIASPFLIFAIPGFLSLRREGGLRRGLALLIALSFLTLLLMNASFNGWHSGASFTARYMVPVFPLVGILAVMAPLRPGWRRGLFGLFAAISLLNMFAAASYTVTPVENDPSPVYVTSYRHLADRTPPPVLMAPLGTQARRPDAAVLLESGRFTLGSLIGLPYLASRVVILLAGLAVWAWLLGGGASTAAVPGSAPAQGAEAPAESRQEGQGASFRERWASTSGMLHDIFLKRQVGLWGVLAGLAASIALLLPGDIPLTLMETLVQGVALDAVERCTFANPLGKWGISALVFQFLYLFTKDILVLAFLKTLLSLLACWLLLSRVAKRSGLPRPLLFLFAAASPYLLLAHRSLRADSLLLPAGAFMLYALVRLMDRNDGASLLKRIALLLVSMLPVPGLLIAPAGPVSQRGPFAVLQTTFVGFADVFHPVLREVDRDAASFLLLLALISVVFAGVPLLTGAVLVFIRKDRAGIVSLVLALLASLVPFVLKQPYHPFHFLYAAPFAAYLEATGAAWFLKGRMLRPAKFVLGVYFALCLCGWIEFMGVIHRDAGNRFDTFGVTLSERLAGAAEINRHAVYPIRPDMGNGAEERMFRPIIWLAALELTRDPYTRRPDAKPTSDFRIEYRDGKLRPPTGYLRIVPQYNLDRSAPYGRQRVPSERNVPRTEGQPVRRRAPEKNEVFFPKPLEN